MISSEPTVTLLFADASTRMLVPPSAKFKRPKKPQGTQNRRAGASAPEPSIKTLGKLKALKDPESKAFFTAIFEGDSFAKKGNRDNALQRVASLMAWADEGATSPQGLLEILRPSLTIWEAEGHEDIWDVALDKIQRAAADYQEKNAGKKAELESLREVLIKGAEPDYKQLALQQDNTFYVYSFNDKEYWPAHTSREFPVVVRDAWPEGSPVALHYFNTKGEVKKKTTPMVLDEYGTVIRSVVHSVSEKKTIYDPTTRVLKVPAAARRPLEPLFDEQIDKWLRLMPAREHHVEMLLDWLSTVPRLDKMSAALYLSGPKSTGKSLLVAGICRLWNQGPTKLKHVFTRFNDAMLNCPVINVDESWHDQKVNLCAELRELVGNLTHQIEPKGRPVVTLEGAVRLIITANNETLLNTRGNGDQNQLERDATIERILHMPTSGEAAKFLKWIKDRHTWREDNRIAKHVLWLEQERADKVIARSIDEGHRFLIQGDETDAEFYDGIGSQPKDHDAAVQWLAKALTTHTPGMIKGMIKAEQDSFVVVPRAVCLSWESFGLAKNFDTPTSSNQASRLLRPFTGNRTKLNGMNAYKIDIARFVRVARNESLVPEKILKEKLGVEA